MAYGLVAFEPGQVVLIEHLHDKPLVLLAHHPPFAVHGNDSAGFLPPVLKGMQPVIDELCGIPHVVDAENAAFLMYLTVIGSIFDFQAGQNLIVSLYHLSHIAAETVLVEFLARIHVPEAA